MELLCRPSMGKLARDLGLVHEHHSVESGRFASLYAGEPSAEMRRFIGRFDTVLLFSSSPDLEARVNAAGDCRVVRLPARPPEGMRMRVAEFILARLWKLGLADTEEPFVPPAMSGGGVRTVILSPGSGSRRKNWSFFCFLDTARRLAVLGHSPEFLLGPAEEHLRGEAGRHPEFRFHLLDDLSDLVLLLHGSGGYVGNDSGVSHLAAWLGLPSVVIFGPSDTLRWTPTGAAVRALKGETRCDPCFEREAENCSEPVCLASLTAGAVVDAFVSVRADAAGR